jgi:TetR/AcrR family fatty acid metabolism transcriptional regulator
MATPADPAREQLTGMRRDQILDAAINVFAEKGFHSATTKQIAKAAGIAEGTIYNYFANKDDLLIGLIARLAEPGQVDERLALVLQSDMREFIVRACRQNMKRIEQNHALLHAILPEVLIRSQLREQFLQQFVLPITRLLERYIRARIWQGQLRPTDLPLVMHTIQGAFVGFLTLRILGDETLISAWDDLPEVMAALILDGLAIRESELAEPAQD